MKAGILGNILPEIPAFLLRSTQKPAQTGVA